MSVEYHLLVDPQGIQLVHKPAPGRHELHDPLLAPSMSEHQPKPISQAEIERAVVALRVALGPRLNGLTDLLVTNLARQVLESASSDNQNTA